MVRGRYGKFQVGRSEPPTPPEPAPRRPELAEPDRLTPADVFGTGFALNNASAPGQDYDIRVDSARGSIQASRGLEHIAGDISAQIATVADRLLGTLATPEDVADFRLLVTDVLNRDNRIKNIESVRASLTTERGRDGTQPQPSAVVIETDIQTVDDERHTLRTPVPVDDFATTGSLSALPLFDAN